MTESSTTRDPLHEAHVRFMEEHRQQDWLDDLLGRYDRMRESGSTEWPKPLIDPKPGLKAVPIKRRG